MARKARARKTLEQRKAEAEALQASIAGQVETLRNSDEWRAFLDFTRSFHSYSFNNLMLIMSQSGGAATRVAGFRQWQAKGRQVRKGERSIKIFGFSKKKTTDEDENGDEVVRYIPRFPILSVFDISQTDLIEGHDDPSAVAAPLTGDDDPGVYDRMAAFLVSQGYAVARAPIAGMAHGYTTADGSRRVVISDRISDAQAAGTIIHEAAHVVLGHVDYDYAEYVQHRGRFETEAESVAYVVAGLLGVDTSAYSIGYVAGWSAGDSELIRDTAERVLTAARTLADALDGEDATDGQAAAAPLALVA